MRRFKNPYLVAVIKTPVLSSFEDEVIPTHIRRSEKTLCTSNRQAINIINGYMFRHDPFQECHSLPLHSVQDQL